MSPLIYHEHPHFLFQTRTQPIQRFLPVKIDCSNSVMASVGQQLPSPGACETCLRTLVSWVTYMLKCVHDGTVLSWWRWCRVPARAHPDNHGAGESAQAAAADRGRGGDAAQLGAGPQWPGRSRLVRQARDAKCCRSLSVSGPDASRTTQWGERRTSAHTLSCLGAPAGCSL